MIKLIFLYGHRKQCGKDASCDITETVLNKNNVTFKKTSFATKLKRHCAERYDLDFARMEYDGYKQSRPKQLNGLTVRDVLIKEGNFARQIWNNVWTSSAWRDIFDSGSQVAMISDFRYPNEYDCFKETFTDWTKSKNIKNIVVPKVIKVLVYREKGTFNSDGADDQLPDLDPGYWDEVILNSIEGYGWHDNIEKQVNQMVQRNLDKYVLNS